MIGYLSAVVQYAVADDHVPHLEEHYRGVGGENLDCQLDIWESRPDTHAPPCPGQTPFRQYKTSIFQREKTLCQSSHSVMKVRAIEVRTFDSAKPTKQKAIICVKQKIYFESKIIS